MPSFLECGILAYGLLWLRCAKFNHDKLQSAIQGEVRDSNDAIIDRPQLVGYTAAVGVLWDISKRPGTRPFQC